MLNGKPVKTEKAARLSHAGFYRLTEYLKKMKEDIENGKYTVSELAALAETELGLVGLRRRTIKGSLTEAGVVMPIRRSAPTSRGSSTSGWSRYSAKWTARWEEATARIQKLEAANAAILRRLEFIETSLGIPAASVRTG